MLIDENSTLRLLNFKLLVDSYIFPSYRTILEMKSYAVSMFPRTIFILAIYFLSTPVMSLDQTYLSVRESVSHFALYSFLLVSQSIERRFFWWELYSYSCVHKFYTSSIYSLMKAQHITHVTLKNLVLLS